MDVCRPKFLTSHACKKTCHYMQRTNVGKQAKRWGFARPAVFRLDPEFAHRFTISLGKVRPSCFPAPAFAPFRYPVSFVIRF